MKKIIRYFKELNRERNRKTHELKRRVKLYTLSRKVNSNITKNLHLPEIKRILFPFVDLGIGDAVCHTGIWKKLKDAGYTVQIIAEERNRALFEKLDCIDEIYIADIRHINSLPHVETDLVISLYSWMKRKELFNTQLLMNINYKYAMSFGGWMTRPYNISIPLEHDFHITHPQQKILDALQVDSSELHYSLPLLRAHDDAIDNYLSAYSNKKIIVINPFASVGERSLSLSELEALATGLAKTQNSHIFIIGEKSKLQTIHIQHDDISISNFNSLWDAVSLIKKADLVISVDTAIVHIASAFDKKMLAIYYTMLLDHNQNLQGNRIFAPHSQNAVQLIFDKHNNKIDIEIVKTEALNLLNEKAGGIVNETVPA
ncbi:glycosyltransferase family 9 protein [Enterobacteriaceae bacterium C34A]